MFFVSSPKIKARPVALAYEIRNVLARDPAVPKWVAEEAEGFCFEAECCGMGCVCYASHGVMISYEP